MDVRNRVTEYLNYCRYRKKLDEKSLKAYRIDLRQFFEFCQCMEPEKERIEAYISDLHGKYRQKTVKRKLASIKAFYNYLEEEEVISQTPFRKIRVKFKEAVVLPRVISRKEIELMLNCLYTNVKQENNEDKYRIRDLAVVETFFATGARVYEISNIRTHCLDLDSGILRIAGKGDKERYLQIVSEDVLDILRKYYIANKACIDKSEFFFVNKRGGRFSEQSIRGMMKKYARQAGINRNITPHMFRHSLATYLIEEGMDISCIQQLLGHSSIRTTQIYIHVAAGRQAEFLKKYHPRRNMKINMG